MPVDIQLLDWSDPIRTFPLVQVPRQLYFGRKSLHLKTFTVTVPCRTRKSPCTTMAMFFTISEPFWDLLSIGIIEMTMRVYPDPAWPVVRQDLIRTQKDPVRRRKGLTVIDPECSKSAKVLPCWKTAARRVRIYIKDRGTRDMRGPMRQRA